MQVRKEYERAGVIQVLLVDDHVIVRQGLRAILETYSDVHVVAEAGDGRQAIEAVRTFRPHIVVMDINMPVMDGIEATACIKQEYPDTIVVGLSFHATKEFREAIIKAGAVGLLTKEAAVEQLYDSIVMAVSASFLSPAPSPDRTGSTTV